MAKNDNAVPHVITIERILERTSGKGKTYWSIAAGGEYYNVWDTMVKDRLAEGETYTLMIVSTESNGKFFHNVVGLGADNMNQPANMAALLPGATPPPAATPSPTPAAKPQPAAAQKQGIYDPMIEVRKTALQCANALLVADLITQKGMNEVLRKYETYILEGLKPEQIFDTKKDAQADVSEFVANE